MSATRSSSKSAGAERVGAWFGGIVVFGLACALTAGACYDPMIVDGRLPCMFKTDCPSGFLCPMSCGHCYHDTPAGQELAQTCAVGDVTGTPDGGTGGGSGAGGVPPGGAGGGGGQTGAGGGGFVGGGAGAGGPGGGVGAGGHGGTVVGSGGTSGGAGMNGAAGATGMGGHIGAGGALAGMGGRTGTGGTIVGGSGGTPGAGGAPGAGGKTGSGGAMGLGGAMMGTGGAPALGALGSKCSVGPQCASTFCVDGVCCNDACAGQCQACDVSPGTCSLVTSGPVHGTRPPCGGAGVCGAQCTLTTAVTAACLFAPMTVSCAPQSCKGSTLTLAQSCNGAGTCAAAESGPCPSGLKCNADQTACLASCATNADCLAPAPNCNPGTHQCTSARAMGSPCSVAGDCQNGLCIDGFCCDGACNGSCQACDVVGQEGHCALVLSGQPHGLRTPCGATTDACGGRCDGTGAQCHFPAGETMCNCPDPLLLGGLIGGSCDGQDHCSTIAGLCIL